jgi:hypothetical protein
MNVKAQALLNGATWVRDNFGVTALEQVLAKCARPVRERCMTAIAINWHPQEELEEFLSVADQTLGRGDGKLAEAIGAAGAQKNLRHMALRLAFFLARPEFLMRRVAGVWRQYNEEGEMLVRDFQRGGMVAELSGLSKPSFIICCSVSGWLTEAGVATGMKHLTTVHIECRARGGHRCLWQLKWHE